VDFCPAFLPCTPRVDTCHSMPLSASSTWHLISLCPLEHALYPCCTLPFPRVSVNSTRYAASRSQSHRCCPVYEPNELMRPTACDQYSRRSLAEAYSTGTTPLFSSLFTLSIMKISLDHANSRSLQDSRSAPYPLKRVDNELTRLTFL
jgi:hypothetical protein